ncbi:MAG: D-alanyl-D-alanine carboxypeptidase [Firmicutes bacterium]|nr:D-alanyl-D-alanine carboxypeptidase [Bacillota bacterium]
MRKKWMAVLMAFVLATASLAMPPVTAAAAETTNAAETVTEGGLDVQAKSAVLMDVATGTVLYEQNAHEELPPASVTKVMTMLLALEAVERGQFSLEDTVTISERAASMGGSQMYMEPGESHTVEELFMGASICSANDACVALAETTKGTEELFVEAMNARAQELGMDHSHFVNTNGLPAEDHYSCAYDIAVMSRELLKHPKPREWFSTWQAEITVGLPGKEKPFGLTNTNKMIKTYPGANGVKTGFTQDAGYCLSASATRGDLTLIAVVMGAESSKIRFSEASRLLDYGFANYEAVKLADQEQMMGSVIVGKGSPQMVGAVTREAVVVLSPKGQKDGITSETSFVEDLKAPLSREDVVGELKVYREGTVIGTYPLYAQEAVERVGLGELYLRLIQSLF